ncbi:pentatricopeptide repeat-containing protein At4g02750-like [Selaginella moellendorffii]|uniref:pentatricopeptide repeat-containing protein At4g02750-like n=1 Tax=Selaginella moellendorffii TaxID=88036 RepID=UPI000D1CB004|nr:pentatricopeptide repeat-containing protein At4g02750-like [Selaginella moellendorffii]|eukprot:XP_024529964.1 pentatricopeptide repeat-containing protein At4g02750-like [Selaginella moellendorffii]
MRDAFLSRESIASALKSCGDGRDLARGREVLASAAIDLSRDTFLANLAVEMFGKCGDLEAAWGIFAGISNRNVFSWTIMIFGFSASGKIEQAKNVFDAAPERDVVSWNTILAVCAQTGDLDGVIEVFDRMPERDLISWNTMLAAYAQKGDHHARGARLIFAQMPERNLVSWATMLQACLAARDLAAALDLFDKMPERNAVAWTIMIQALAQRGDVADSIQIYESMPEPSVVSSNAILGLLVARHKLDKARHLEEARWMLESMPEWELWTWNSLLAGYTQQGHLGLAQEILALMPERDIVSWNSILAAFSHRGNLQESKRIFQRMPEWNVVSWTSVISACSQSGDGAQATDLFREMIQHGLLPDQVAYLSALVACSHAGRLREGHEIFVSMSGDCGVKPQPRHYCSMLDLLGRTGRLSQARELLETMPYVPDGAARRGFLGSQRSRHGLSSSDCAVLGSILVAEKAVPT